MLGFEARIAVREGLERTIAWIHEHPALIDRSIEKHAERMPRQ